MRPNLIKINPYFDLKSENTLKRNFIIDGHARLWMSACLFTSDVVSILTAFLIASQIRRLPHLEDSAGYRGLFLLLVMILMLLFYLRGLYPGVGIHYVDELRYIVSDTALAYLGVIGFTFVLQTGLVYSRLILIFAAVLSMGLIPLNRYLIRRPLIFWRLWGEPALIIGDSHKARSMQDYFMVNLQLGIRPVAVVDNENPMVTNGNFICPAQPFCSIKLLARQLSIRTALVIIDDIEDVHQLANKYHPIFHRVIFIKDQKDNYALASLQTLDFINVIGLQVRNDLLSGTSQAFKRLIDVIGSLLGILVLAPLMGLIAIVIKCDSPGPVFYRQLRMGKNGKVFQMFKFRSMHYNSTQIFNAAMRTDLKLQQEWKKYQKLINDPRITRVGRIMRKFSIDELPQLWNVLVGEMSMVGPRPFMPDQRKLYGEYIKNYYSVVPGMTGLWQVSGRNETTFAERVVLDIEYIQRWSLWLDIYILFKTIKIIIFTRNGH